MAKCPKCGTIVGSATKTWKMAGRPDRTGKRMQLEIGLFDCPQCHKPFRVVLDKRMIGRTRRAKAYRPKAKAEQPVVTKMEKTLAQLRKRLTVLEEKITEEKHTKCPLCNAEMPNQAKFCGYCGAEMKKTKIEA